MPFTPSHAVVALPFLRTPLAPAAVAIGAMTPDLPLFVRSMPVDYAMGHSFAWLPATMLVALLLLLLWRCALRPAVRELSPAWLAARLPGEWDAGAGAGMRETFARRGSSRPSWTGTALLLLALAIGVASHIAWDAFTHEGREGVSFLPVLEQQWGPLTGYKWLQHASSLLGLLVLGVWAPLRLLRARAVPVTRTAPGWVRGCWWASLPATLAVAAVWGYARLGPFTSEFTPAHLGYQVLLAACGYWAVVTVVLCLGLQWRRRARDSARRRGDTPGMRP